jgi:hypothetical protein
MSPQGWAYSGREAVSDRDRVNQLLPTPPRPIAGVYG